MAENGLDKTALVNPETLYRQTKDVRYLILAIAKPNSSHHANETNLPEWIKAACKEYFSNIASIPPNDRKTVNDATNPPAREIDSRSKFMQVLKIQQEMQQHELEKWLTAIDGSAPNTVRPKEVSFREACLASGLIDENSTRQNVDAQYRAIHGQLKRNEYDLAGRKIAKQIDDEDMFAKDVSILSEEEAALLRKL